MKAKLLSIIMILMSFSTINSQTMYNFNTNTSIAPIEKLNLTQEWDKVYPKSDKVDHKEMLIIADATHTDLYDNLQKIPFDQIEAFFNRWMPRN